MRAHPVLSLFKDGVVYLRVVHACRHLGVRVSADPGINAEVTHRAASGRYVWADGHVSCMVHARGTSR